MCMRLVARYSDDARTGIILCSGDTVAIDERCRVAGARSASHLQSSCAVRQSCCLEKELGYRSCLSHIFSAGSHNARKKSTAKKHNRITHAGSPGSIVDLSHNRLTMKCWRIWIGIVRQSVIYSKSWFITCVITDFYGSLHHLTSCNTSEYWFWIVIYSIWWVAAHHNIGFLL